MRRFRAVRFRRTQFVSDWPFRRSPVCPSSCDSALDLCDCPSYIALDLWFCEFAGYHVRAAPREMQNATISVCRTGHCGQLTRKGSSSTGHGWSSRHETRNIGASAVTSAVTATVTAAVAAAVTAVVTAAVTAAWNRMHKTLG